jgi:F-type H+-transporting ATPase subunit epsilon
MSDPAKVVNVVIVASDRPVWSGDVQYVVIPAESGNMAFLPNHEPLLTVVGKGTVTVTTLEGAKRSFLVDDGFASFDSNKLTVAVENCEEVEETPNAAIVQ